MDKMNITSAQYVAYDGVNDHIDVVIDGDTYSVPLALGNRHYEEIMRQVEAGELTIQEAD
jgi:hypothetical protein